jgi:hypothetical protein
MKMKAGFVLALALGCPLAAGPAGAENWVPVAGSTIRINADELMYSKQGGRVFLVFKARHGDLAGRYYIKVDCSGTALSLFSTEGEGFRDDVDWPPGTVGGDWRDRVCKPFMK